MQRSGTFWARLYGSIDTLHVLDVYDAGACVQLLPVHAGSSALPTRVQAAAIQICKRR
jgi:hypothetical protein